MQRFHVLCSWGTLDKIDPSDRYKSAGMILFSRLVARPRHRFLATLPGHATFGSFRKRFAFSDSSNRFEHYSRIVAVGFFFHSGEERDLGSLVLGEDAGACTITQVGSSGISRSLPLLLHLAQSWNADGLSHLRTRGEAALTDVARTLGHPAFQEEIRSRGFQLDNFLVFTTVSPPRLLGNSSMTPDLLNRREDAELQVELDACPQDVHLERHVFLLRDVACRLGTGEFSGHYIHVACAFQHSLHPIVIVTDDTKV